jgi:hypothetical protein
MSVMNIQIRFEDKTTEMRDASSPCIADIFEPTLRHPSEERWYLYFPEDGHPLSFCACGVRPLSAWRGGAIVWRITGQDPKTKALTGEWQSCRVETFEEQIARLTAAVANEIARANLAEEVARRERDRADTLLRELKRAESDVTLFRGERDHAQFNAEQAAIRAEHLADRLRALGQDPDA